jgi:hypothetical protein
VGSGAIVNHRIDLSPNLGLRISRSFHNAVANVSVARTVNPGNGLFLTSISNTLSGQLSYNGVRHWSFGTQFNYSKSKAISNVVGKYDNISGGVSASRKIARSIHGVADFNIRQYDSRSFGAYNRLIYRASVGLSWSPGDMPLRVW